MGDVIRVFVGGTREHWLPTKVLEHSILRHTDSDVQVTPLCDVPIAIPDIGRSTPTTFSLQRFLIPEACGFEGRGIYLDSDMVVKSDIRGLWDAPFPDQCLVQVCHDWQSAVMLIDAAVGWRIADLAAHVRDGHWTYARLSSLKVFPAGTSQNSLPRGWNCCDTPCDPCHLLHFTRMSTQPWLWANHEFGTHWTNELVECLASGFVTREDVIDEINLGHIRPSLALLIGEEAPYEDAQFVFPNDKRKAAR